MIKRILYYVLAVLVVFAITFFTHKSVLSAKSLVLSFNLIDVYLFNLISCIVIYVSMEFMAEKLPSEAGYAFLALVFVKMGVFLLLFQSVVFSETPLEMYQRLSLLIPFFLFLVIEAVGVAKLLNSKTY